MFFLQNKIVFVLFLFLNSSLAAFVRIMFEKCDTKGFKCENSKEISGKTDVIFECSNITSHDVQLYLWQFNSPSTITSLTVQHCKNVQLSFSCNSENKPIQWFKLKNITNLEILPIGTTHNPPKIIFENISNIETLPAKTFVQILKTSYRPSCFNPVSDLNSISFKNVVIGTIETEAFKNLSDMKYFNWQNVTVEKTSYGAIKVQLVDKASVLVQNFQVNVLEPLAFQVIGDGFSMVQTKIQTMWASSINGTIYDFEFSNNSVSNIQSGAISVLAQNVLINNNYFGNVESGAFQRISPGLLHDSQRNFGKVLFTYKFDNNVIDHVEDGGVRPDIQAYRNVAAEVTYVHNTLQCSCESLAWLGADIELGYGFSVLKDFNIMMLDSRNKNTCNFKPCMCFGMHSLHQQENNRSIAVF